MAEETIPSLVVRVKRKRSQLPTESLCIIQDDNEPSQKKALTTITNQIQQLNHQDNSINSTVNNQQKFMILNRIDTIDSNSNAAVSQAMRDKDNKSNKRTLNTTATTNNNENTKDSINTTNNMLFIPKKKTTLLSSYHSDCILLDMMQVDLATTSTTTTTSNNNHNNTIKTKILDPATRQLNGAILIANKTSDFNGVSLAISHGANVNHRTTDITGGLTALMVATMKCNVRMAKRLLGQCADVLVTNTIGQTALDIARTLEVSPDKFGVKLELQQWLYRATIQQRTKSSDSSSTQDRMRRMLILARDQLGGSNAGDPHTDTVTAHMGEKEQDEYVFDIFQCPSASLYRGSSSQASPSDPITATPALYDTTTMPFSCPVVPVEGLRFLSDGGVELAFEYDSDWSALADDDTDSNAENNPANDYPDEEESEVEEEEEESEDSDDDDENKVYARSAYKNSKNNGGADSDSDEREDRFRPDLSDNIFTSSTAGHKHKKNDTSRGTHARGHDSLLANLLGQDDEDEELPDMYQSQSIGRVLQPHVIGEGYVEGSGSGGQMVSRTTENIQRIWGEYDENDDNSDGDDEGAVTSYTRGNLHIYHI